MAINVSFDSVEVGRPVRRLTSASVQPWRRRSALRTAPGLAVDFGGESGSAAVSAAAFVPTGFLSATDAAATPASYLVRDSAKHLVASSNSPSALNVDAWLDRSPVSPHNARASLR